MKNKELSFPEVDYAKSVAKGKIVYKKSRGLIYQYTLFYSLPIVLIIIDSIACYNSALSGNYIVSALCLVVCLWSLLSMLLFGKLFKVTGKSILQNKEDAIKAIEECYKGLTFNISKENILRDYQQGSFMQGGRVVTILFNNSEVYFHKMSLGRGDTMMAFYPLIDYFKTKEIAEYFAYIQINRDKAITNAQRL